MDHLFSATPATSAYLGAGWGRCGSASTFPDPGWLRTGTEWGEVSTTVVRLPCRTPARGVPVGDWGAAALAGVASAALAVDSTPVLDPAPESGTGVNLSKVDDATLARALIERNPAAPRAVWSRFSPMVRRIVRRSLGPEQDVEDVVQDVFASLFAKPSRLREPGAFKAFIVSVTLHNISYELRRRRVRRWVGLSQTSELPDIRVVETNPESREALARFYRILDNVKARDRSAFVLRFIEGMEVADVAAALDTSVPTARRCFTRAFKRVSLLAGRDPFLAEYLAELKVGRG
jgi:RNA polymerase sigma-70 factor, ECF subfamily